MEIQKLASEVVDQIAAGEVVERPAHLVKELVENSIDAGSTEVEVEFAQGGRYVRVTDNGCGIPGDQLPLALERHATSKIFNSGDIWSLNTFGFRGEALATIGAVSQLSLTSRTKEQSSASRIISRFGEKSPVEHIGGKQGTTVQVEELFSNVPARLKFLKSDAAEGTAIKNVIKALALSYHQVSFRLRGKGKMIFFWPQTKDHKERVEQVLDQEKMYTGKAERNSIKARAVFASPNNTFRTRQNIWLFAQGRWVQDKSLQAAVMEAHRSLLMHGEFPICAIWVDCSPQEIDVNIHPSKSQVKFRDPSSAFRVVQAALRESLEKAPWLNDVLGDSPSENMLTKNNGQHTNAHKVTPYSSMNQTTAQNPSESIAFEGEDFKRVQFHQKNSVERGGSDLGSGFGSSLSSHLGSSPLGVSSTDPTYEPSSTLSSTPESPNTSPNLAASERASERPELEPSQSSSLSPSPSSSQEQEQKQKQKSSYWNYLQVIGQVNLTYIVTQSQRGMILVDQHAAHERVIFESLMAAWKGGKVEVQKFLLPPTIQLPEDQLEALLTQEESLKKLGIHIEAQGPSTVGVQAAPVMVKDSCLTKTLTQLAVDMVEKNGSYAMERAIIDICATIACHSAIRAGQSLSKEEMSDLLSQMDLFPMSSFCPHGRPVYVEYSFHKMEKDFGRIV